MKLTSSFLLLALYASTSTAILGFGTNVYNKWHETELERWLSDHDVPHPTPADRKDLENLVKDNWDRHVSSPYSDWDTRRLQDYLTQKGIELNAQTKDNKDWLVNTVKKNWYETEQTTEGAYANVVNWIFDTWTDSQLKAFLDRHGIPNPTPRKRDTMLKAARENYQTIAQKVGETAAYPGNWLYETWSDSDLKKWLDERGIPAPQPSTRDKLIAHVRRNSRIASLKYQNAEANARVTAEDAKEKAVNAIFDSWSDSQIKEWADKNNIKVPQGSTRNELIALARRNKAYLNEDTISAYMSKAYASATNTVASSYNQATEAASAYTQAAFDKAIEAWSDTRLKEYLDSRGVPVPQNGKRDELLAKVRLHRHKLSTGYGAWTFDTWTYDNLKKYVESQGNKASKAATDTTTKTRDELVKEAKAVYAAAVASGGSTLESVKSAIAQTTDAAKASTFETWSDSDLKAYLDSYGINTYQGTTRNELVAAARRAQHLFLYGSAGPKESVFNKFQDVAGWVYNQIAGAAGFASAKSKNAADAIAKEAKDSFNEGEKAYQKKKDEL
jgi:hypothetical protein